MTMQLSHDQLDALREIINIGVGRAAGMLNQMVSNPITLQVPDIAILAIEDYEKKLGEILAEKLAIVQLGFRGACSGVAELMFPVESANNLVAVLTDEEPGTPDLDSAKTAALTEVGNIVLNCVMGSFANILKQRFSYDLPSYSDDARQVLRKTPEGKVNDRIVYSQVNFVIKDLEIVGDIILLFEMGSFDAVLSYIDNLMKEMGG